MCKAKYRIIKRGPAYILQERVLWFFWSGFMDLDKNKNPMTVRFTSLKAADSYMLRRINEKNEAVKTKTYLFDENGKLI